MDTVENARTGERVTFVSETSDLLVMEVAWTRPGHRALEELAAEVRLPSPPG